MRRTLSFVHYDPKGSGRWDLSKRGGRLTLAAARAGFHAPADLATERGDLRAYFAKLEAEREDERRKAEIEARAGTFGDLLDAYVEHLRAEERPSAAQVDGIFERYIRKPFPRLLRQRANLIAPEDVQAILARMVEAGVGRQTNITRSYLSAAFTHAGKRHDYDPRRLAHDKKAFRLGSMSREIEN